AGDRRCRRRADGGRRAGRRRGGRRRRGRRGRRGGRRGRRRRRGGRGGRRRGRRCRRRGGRRIGDLDPTGHAAVDRAVVRVRAGGVNFSSYDPSGRISPESNDRLPGSDVTVCLLGVLLVQITWSLTWIWVTTWL